MKQVTFLFMNLQIYKSESCICYRMMSCKNLLLFQNNHFFQWLGVSHILIWGAQYLGMENGKKYKKITTSMQSAKIAATGLN